MDERPGAPPYRGLTSDNGRPRGVDERNYEEIVEVVGVSERYDGGPVAALRTLKSEVITGLTAATEARLVAAEGQCWRTDGTHALIQVNRSVPEGT